MKLSLSKLFTFTAMESATNHESILDIKENHETNSIITLWNFIAPKISVARNIIFSAITDLLDRSKFEEDKPKAESLSSLHWKNTEKTVWTLSTTAGKQGSLHNINLKPSMLNVLHDLNLNAEERRRSLQNFQLKCHSNHKFKEENHALCLRLTGEEELSENSRYVPQEMKQCKSSSSVGLFSEDSITSKKSNSLVGRKKNLVIKCNYSTILNPVSNNIIKIYRRDSMRQLMPPRKTPNFSGKQPLYDDKKRKPDEKKCASRESPPSFKKKRRHLKVQTEKLRSEESSEYRTPIQSKSPLKPSNQQSCQKGRILKKEVSPLYTDRSGYARILSNLGIRGLQMSSIPKRRTCKEIKSCTFAEPPESDRSCDSNVTNDSPSHESLSCNHIPSALSCFTSHQNLPRFTRCAETTSNLGKSCKSTQCIPRTFHNRKAIPKSGKSRQCPPSFCGFKSRILASACPPCSTRSTTPASRFSSRPDLLPLYIPRQSEAFTDALQDDSNLNHHSNKSRKPAFPHLISSKQRKSPKKLERGYLSIISRSANQARGCSTQSSPSRIVTSANKSRGRRKLCYQNPSLQADVYDIPLFSIEEPSSDTDVCYGKNIFSLPNNQDIFHTRRKFNRPRCMPRRKCVSSSLRYSPRNQMNYSSDNFSRNHPWEYFDLPYESSNSTEDYYHYPRWYDAHQLVDHPVRGPYLSEENMYYCPNYMFSCPPILLPPGAVHRLPPPAFSPSLSRVPVSQPICPYPCSPPSLSSLIPYSPSHHYHTQPYSSWGGSYPYVVESLTPCSSRTSTASISSNELQLDTPHWRSPYCRPILKKNKSGMPHTRSLLCLYKNVGRPFSHKKISKRFIRKMDMERNQYKGYPMNCKSRCFSTPGCPGGAYRRSSFFETVPSVSHIRWGNCSSYPRSPYTQVPSDLMYRSEYSSQVPETRNSVFHPFYPYHLENDHKINGMNRSHHRNKMFGRSNCASSIFSNGLAKLKAATSRKADTISSITSFISSSSMSSSSSFSRSNSAKTSASYFLTEKKSLNGKHKGHHSTKWSSSRTPSEIYDKNNKCPNKMGSCEFSNFFPKLSPYKRIICSGNPRDKAFYKTDSALNPTMSRSIMIGQRSQVCSSATGVHWNSKHRRGKINHFDNKIKFELQKIGINQLIKACKPAKCCKQTILNQPSKDELPYAASLASLPLDRTDIKVIKQSVKMASKKGYFNNSSVKNRKKLMYYANILSDDFDTMKPRIEHKYEVRFFYYKLDDEIKVQNLIRKRYDMKKKYKFYLLINLFFQRSIYKSTLTFSSQSNSFPYFDSDNVISIVFNKILCSLNSDKVSHFDKPTEHKSQIIVLLNTLNAYYEFQLYKMQILRKHNCLQKTRTSVMFDSSSKYIHDWQTQTCRFAKIWFKLIRRLLNLCTETQLALCHEKFSKSKYNFKFSITPEEEFIMGIFHFELNFSQKIAHPCIKSNIYCRILSKMGTTLILSIKHFFLEANDTSTNHKSVNEIVNINTCQNSDYMKFSNTQKNIENFILSMTPETKVLVEEKDDMATTSFFDVFKLNDCVRIYNQQMCSAEKITTITCAEYNLESSFFGITAISLIASNDKSDIRMVIDNKYCYLCKFPRGRLILKMATNNQNFKRGIDIEKMRVSYSPLSSAKTELEEIIHRLKYTLRERKMSWILLFLQKPCKQSFSMTYVHNKTESDQAVMIELGINRNEDKNLRITLYDQEKICFIKSQMDVSCRNLNALYKSAASIKLGGLTSNKNNQVIPILHNFLANILKGGYEFQQKLTLRTNESNMRLQNVLLNHVMFKYRRFHNSGYLLFCQYSPEQASLLIGISILHIKEPATNSFYNPKNISMKGICCQQRKQKCEIYYRNVEPITRKCKVDWTMIMIGQLALNYKLIDICSVSDSNFLDTTFHSRSKITSRIFTEDGMITANSKQKIYKLFSSDRSHMHLNYKRTELYKYKTKSSRCGGMSEVKLGVLRIALRSRSEGLLEYTNQNQKMNTVNVDILKNIENINYIHDQHISRKRELKKNISKKLCCLSFADVITQYYELSKKYWTNERSTRDSKIFSGKLETKEENKCNYEKPNSTSSQRRLLSRETNVTTVLPCCGTTGSIVQRDRDSLESLLDDCLENGKLINPGDNRQRDRRKMINYQMVEDTLMECLNLTRHPNSMQRMSHTILRYFTYTVFNQIKKNYNKYLSKKERRNNYNTRQDATILYFNSRHSHAFSLGNIYINPEEIKEDLKSKEEKSKYSNGQNSSSQDHEENTNSALSLNAPNIEAKVSSKDAFLCNLPNAPPFILKMNKTSFSTELIETKGEEITKDDQNEHSSKPTSMIDSLEIGRVSYISSVLSGNNERTGYSEMSKHNLFIDNTCPPFSNQDFRGFLGKSINFIENNRNLSIRKSRGCFMSSPTVCMTGLSGFSMNPFNMDEKDSRRLCQNISSRPSEDILSNETSHHYHSKIPRMLHPGKYKVHSKMKNVQLSPGAKGYTASKSQACSSKVCSVCCPTEKTDILINPNVKISVSTTCPSATNNCASANVRPEKNPCVNKNFKMQIPVSRSLIGDCVKGIKSDPGCYCAKDPVELTTCPVRLKETLDYVEDDITKEADEEDEGLCYCPPGEQPLLMKKSNIECDCANRNRCETEKLVEPPVEKPNVFWALTKVSLLKDGTKNFEIIDVSPLPPGYYLMPEVNNLILVGPQPKPMKAPPNKNCSCT